MHREAHSFFDEMIPEKKILTRGIWILSFVSLFTDVASEMLYPIMPVYLKTIGFTALWIGLLEGFAEFIVGLSKGYFGQLSDEKGSRLPFVRLGYSLSAISKPLMALFIQPLGIFFARFTDRLGKGIRTGARDAMLSDQCTKENKGKVFGFHRALDTVGAAIGPIIALIYLKFHPGEYRNLFLIAFIPGVLAISLTFLLKEKKNSIEKPVLEKRSFFSYMGYWKVAGDEYKKVVAGLLLFALFNSSDAFLLLMVKESGLTDTEVITAYIFYNLVYALFSYPAGMLADKIGMKAMLIVGLLLFVIVYGGMSFADSTLMIYGLFFLYGIYASCTEGISKAWIARLSPKNETATAIGFHASATSILTMAASGIAGLLWVMFNPVFTFFFAAAGVLMTSLYFLLVVREREISKV
jgi:MFS family permease